MELEMELETWNLKWNIFIQFETSLDQINASYLINCIFVYTCALTYYNGMTTVNLVILLSLSNTNLCIFSVISIVVPVVAVILLVIIVIVIVMVLQKRRR